RGDSDKTKKPQEIPVASLTAAILRQDGLFYAFLETLKQFVAAFHHIFQAGFGRNFAGKDLFHDTVLDIADLRQVAQAYTARVFGSGCVELPDGDVGARVLFIEAGLFRELETCGGDGNVAGVL